MRARHVHAFLQRYYVPTRMTLVVSGGFEPDRARAWIERYFGPLRASGAETPPPPAIPPPVSFAGERLYEPDFSLQLGTAYLADVLGMFDGNVELALAGYNSGPYRLRRLWKESRHGEVDAFIEDLQLEEPKAYVRRILLLSDSYSRLYPELTAG